MSASIFATDGEAGRYEKLSAMTAATPFTPTNVEYKGKIAQAVLITVETQSIRFTLDGTTATVTVGHKMDAGQSYVVRGEKSIRNFMAINAVASNGAELYCTLFFAK
jgi:hypothetical protein